MALLDFLKNRKQAERSRKPGKRASEVRVDKKQDEESARHNASALGGEKPDKSASRNLTGKTKSNTFSFDAIKQPHISEKGSYLAEKNQYIFEVGPSFSKQEIKKSVEGIYGVNVLSVNTIKIPAKKRRLGKTEGFRKKYKKAIITVKEGQKIEIL